MERSLKNEKPIGKNKLFGVRDTHSSVQSAAINDASTTQQHNWRRRDAVIEAEYKRAQAVTTFRRYIIR